MPSFRHEAPLELLRRCPELLVELVRGALGAPLPDFTGTRVTEAELGQLVPTSRTADLVIELEREGAIVMALIVECQLRPDADKPHLWPSHVAALHDKLRCPVVLVVLVPSDAMARWAERPAPTLGPCLSFSPIVLGPQRVPRITRAEDARDWPELAVLSAITHVGDPEAFVIARAALDIIDAIDRDRGSLYCSIVLGTVNSATRRALEAYMEANKHKFYSDWERRHFEKGERTGLEKGREQGREEGRKEGREEGRKEARRALVVSARSSILEDFAARLGEVPAELRLAVESCDDVEVLLGWVAGVARCESVDQARRVIAGS